MTANLENMRFYSAFNMFLVNAFIISYLNASDSPVTGEVYEVDDELLSQLDDFEAASHYQRKQVEISLGAHRKTCWIYEPDPEFYTLRTVITSGDWIEYAQTKTDWPGDPRFDETQS